MRREEEGASASSPRPLRRGGTRRGRARAENVGDGGGAVAPPSAERSAERARRELTLTASATAKAE